MPHILGIDLGTTNTAVAVLEGGRPRVIEDDRGYKVLPSVVSAKGEGRFVVGQAAHNLILTRPDRTVYATKRLIGRRFDSTEVERVRKRVHYEIREASDGGIQLQVGDAWMTPQEVAAVVLQVARGIAEKALGETIEEAVITVPAHFNHAQRKATLEAAELAGLRCERLLNEPTAAALAYGHRKNVERTLVIFDLGGGTFDVSVLRLSSGIYEILSTSGDTFLGGEDFDYRIVDHLVDGFKSATGIDLRGDRAALQRVKDAAERAKCELSFSDTTTVVVPHVATGKNLESTLTRRILEALTADLVDRCVEIARGAVVDAGLSIPEIDEVILVGGQTRMPRVRESVAGVFGREPSRSVHPEEAVAIGAAVHAATLGDVEGTPAVLLDVTPFDLGIDAAGGLFSMIVPRNAKIPCIETRNFATVHDEQTTVKVTVRQGESRLAEENEFLGEFLFEGLTPAPRMETKVAVQFRIDANGMLHVGATEMGTGERRHIAIRNYADHSRSVVRPPGVSPAGEAAAAPALPQADAKVKKKKGFLDQIFGAGDKKKTKTKKPAAAKAAAPPPVAAPAADPATLAPPPTIDALPPAPPPTDEAEDVPADALSALDEGEGDFAMPEDLPEEALYEPAPASFGLAGSHQVGAAAGGADPFADLGAPAPPPPSGRGGEPFPDRDAPDALDAEELFGEELFGEDLFGELPPEDAQPEDEQDPPTDPGLRFPSAPPVSAAPPPPAPAPAASEPSGLLFEHMVESDDPFGFAMEEPEAPAEPIAEEDLFGFDFADLAKDEAADKDAEPDMPTSSQGWSTYEGKEKGTQKPTPNLAKPAPKEDRGAADDDFAYAFPMPDDAPAPEPKKKKPARVRLQYPDREAFTAEYRANLQKGGAFIRTEKPLAVGRECVFEVSAPGLPSPLVLNAQVTRVNAEGMEVVYVLDLDARAAMLRVVG